MFVYFLRKAKRPSWVTCLAIVIRSPYSYSKRGVTVGRGRMVAGRQLVMLVVLGRLSWLDTKWQSAGR